MKKLTGPNTTVFMVGDVKQSIYGFRGSSPEWFLEKYNRMKQDEENEDVFDMNVNFRSSPTILEFINIVFSKLMKKEIADSDYEKDCLVEPQRDDIVDEKVKILLVREDKEEGVPNGVYSVKNHTQKTTTKAKDKEAKLVLKIITELVGTEFYDANKKERRELTYGDIAILTHSDKDEASTVLIDLLKQNSVPLNLNNKLEIDSSETIRLVLSILKCVAQTADDVDYFATMMSLTNLTIDEIVQIRDKNFTFYENLQIIMQNLVKNDIFLKISSGFKILEDITTASYSMTNRELISYILNEKKLKYFILNKPNGEKELNLLEEFLMKLTSLEDSLGLSEFIEVVESNVNSSGDFSSVDKADSVTLQTIHKSKGLEYPVVILFNSSKLFAYHREHDAINFNVDIGFGIDYFDTLNRVKMDSLTKLAIKIANSKKGYKEELRLLYVAMTRAKNKLFITGSVSNNLDLNDINKTSYTNMLLDCFKDQIQDGKLEKEHFVLEIKDEVDDIKFKSKQTEKTFEIADVDFNYPNQNKFSIPFKNTVTGINRQVSQESDYKLKNVISKETQYNVEDKAIIGVHYHSALEKLDLTAPYVENKEFDDVDYEKIRLAHQVLSPLTKDAIKIDKEADFMMWVPYCEVVESEITDRVLVQGVVDLIIEKENSIVLVDYKFSSLPAKVLKEKYMEQLKLYKLAIESAYKKNVQQMFIYSINTGELI
ncbi:MAG: UvrD-helicase domain-containing protein [Clostridia bacterium]|nr:UvrD-helicase domain-containing protein [Clostridia bacterium]